MEAPEDDIMIESELDLDDLIEENFELRDHGWSNSRLHKLRGNAITVSVHDKGHSKYLYITFFVNYRGSEHKYVKRCLLISKKV